MSISDNTIVTSVSFFDYMLVARISTILIEKSTFSDLQSTTDSSSVFNILENNKFSVIGATVEYFNTQVFSVTKSEFSISGGSTIRRMKS